MRLQAEFSVQDKQLPAAFGSFQDISDGGFQRGVQAEYDRFWDAYQQNGKRSYYDSAFMNDYWTPENFKPKYDLKPKTAQGMFQRSGIADLEAALETAGIVLDTSECTDVYRMFTTSDHADGVIPALDLSKATNLAEMFSYANYGIIRKITLNDAGTQDLSTMFHGGMVSLKEIRFEGVIGSNFRPQWSGTLSDESVQSIIDHLKDLTGQTAKTLTFHASVGARLTEAQKAAITAKNWNLVY